MKNKNILLVDDILFNILYAKQLLELEYGCVHIADNGLKAVEMMQQQRFDLVLMDLEMPVMDGYTAAVNIRKFNKTTPIIALTALTAKKVKNKITAAGMQGLVNKPFNTNVLFASINKLCGITT